jgi:anti-sigma B factor antagonist
VSVKPFELTIGKTLGEGECVVLQIAGFLDAHTVVGFEKQMDSLLEGGAVRIVLDLEKLSYISSAGIGAMMGLAQRLRRKDGDMILLRPSTKVFRILELLGFAEMFKIAQSEDDAMAQLPEMGSE